METIEVIVSRDAGETSSSASTVRATTAAAALRDAFRAEGRVIELAEYEPKMNVTPNAVATKDD